MLIIVFHLLRDGSIYRDLGSNYFDERDRTATVKRAVARIARLGFDVNVIPRAA
jgi:transposase